MDNFGGGKYSEHVSSDGSSTQPDSSMSAWGNSQAGAEPTEQSELNERQEQEASATLLDEGSARSAADSSDEAEGVFRDVDGDGVDSDNSDSVRHRVLPAAAGQGDEEGSVEGDRLVLEELFTAMGGPSWVRKDNWLSPLPLDKWHGITTDELGRVTGITLVNNHVAGRLSTGAHASAHIPSSHNLTAFSVD